MQGAKKTKKLLRLIEANVRVIGRDNVCLKTYLIDMGFPRPIAGPVNLSSLPYRTIEGGSEVETSTRTCDFMLRKINTKGFC